MTKFTTLLSVSRLFSFFHDRSAFTRGRRDGRGAQRPFGGNAALRCDVRKPGVKSVQVEEKLGYAL
jgi:hypothetical protein